LFIAVLLALPSIGTSANILQFNFEADQGDIVTNTSSDLNGTLMNGQYKTGLNDIFHSLRFDASGSVTLAHNPLMNVLQEVSVSTWIRPHNLDKKSKYYWQK